MPVAGYSDYWVSSLGRVFSRPRKRTPGGFLPKSGVPRKCKDGYPVVYLYRDSVGKNCWIHRLIWESFRGEIPKGKVIRHLNDIRDDCRLENLEIGTYTDNFYDAVRNGKRKSQDDPCPYGHLKIEPNLRACSLKRGKKVCLACYRAAIYITTQKRRKGVDLSANRRSMADSHYEKIMGKD